MKTEQDRNPKEESMPATAETEEIAKAIVEEWYAGDMTYPHKLAASISSALARHSAAKDRAERAEDVLENNCLIFAEVRGFIESWDWKTPESYSQRTPKEKELYQLWICLKKKIESELASRDREIADLRKQIQG